MLDTLNAVFSQLGHFYLAGQVLRDSGFLTYDVTAYARYFFARVGLPVIDE